jgi:hypothetical protein
MPKTDSALPIREKLLNANELPKWTKSNVDKQDPKRANPMTAKALDILAKQRSASALPTIVMSRIDTCDP